MSASVLGLAVGSGGALPPFPTPTGSSLLPPVLRVGPVNKSAIKVASAAMSTLTEPPAVHCYLLLRRPAHAASGPLDDQTPLLISAFS